MYYLIRRKTGGGASEAHDTEYDVAQLTLSGDAGATVQLPGLGGALEIQGRGGGQAKYSTRKLDCIVNGKSRSSGSLAEGDSVQLPGYLLEVIAPPQGFDFALQITADETSVAAMFGTAQDLAATGWSIRRGAWIAALLVLVVGLVLPGLGLFNPEAGALMRATPLPDDNLWSSGPLAAAHRTAGITTDCQSCHTKPFVMVQDAACLDCHREMTEHVVIEGHPADTFTGTRCASCHREHNEPARIVQRQKGLCVDCHAETQSMQLKSDNPLQGVRGFTANEHPQFRLALLQPKGRGGALGWSTTRTRRSEGELVETSNLKFTHALHLDADKVQEQGSGEALVCASCHTPLDDGEHFEAVTMDKDCRSCHALSFDSLEPDLQLPHGDLRAAVVAMEAHFIREFTDPELRRQRAATKPRRVPGKRESAGSCQGSGLDCGRAEALKEAEYQFANTGCISCHVVLDTGLEDINDRWYVQPVRVTGDWYPHSRFDHASHLSQAWDEPVEVCESCHKASESEESADILIPGQDNCLECHAEDSGRSVAVECVSCHAFHQESATLSSGVREEGKL